MDFDEKAFEIVGEIAGIEVIAIRSPIRGIRQLERLFGRGRWRELKGTAHWYEAHGIGSRRLKIKRYLD